MWLQEDFDVFTVLSCYGLKDFITGDKCNFGRGTGYLLDGRFCICDQLNVLVFRILKYYLYNWQGPTMEDTEMGFLAL